MQNRIEHCQNCNGAVLPKNTPMGWGGPICSCAVPHLSSRDPLLVWNETNILRDKIEHLEYVAEIWKRKYAEECRKNEGFISRIFKKFKQV